MNERYICTYDYSVNSETTYDSVTSNCPVSVSHVRVTGTDSPNSDIVVIPGTACH